MRKMVWSNLRGRFSHVNISEISFSWKMIDTYCICCINYPENKPDTELMYPIVILKPNKNMNMIKNTFQIK